jgi:hypothetical protein
MRWARGKRFWDKITKCPIGGGALKSAEKVYNILFEWPQSAEEEETYLNLKSL